MVLHARFYLTILALWPVVLSKLVRGCLQPCESKNNTKIECPFYLTLTDSTRNISDAVITCCDCSDVISTNRTYTKVMIMLSDDDNSSVVNFKYPTLVTYSITLRGTFINKLSLQLRAKYVNNIDLSSNNFTIINKELFEKFSNLKILNLMNNSISEIEEESFKGQVALEYLDLSRNCLKNLTRFLIPLKDLQTLNLSRNNIEYIQESYFNNSLLQNLDLSHNNLQKISPGALQQLPNLARLLLTDNPLIGATQIDWLVGTGRRLQQIDASRTGLYQVPEAFTHSVRFLSLMGNHIGAVRSGDFDTYPLLQSLDLAHNRITLIEDDSLGRLEMLLLLNINMNMLRSVPRSLNNELKYLSINDNSLNNLTKLDFVNLYNLRILLLRNNKIPYIEDQTFENLFALEILDLSNNPIQTLSASAFDGPSSLRDLRLCYLNIMVTERDVFFPMSSPESIQMLHLQSSPSLAQLLLADSAALAALSHLRYLDLRMNNLSEIRNDLLFYLGNLKTLRLHGNDLNCTAELWLMDWLNWNGSVPNGETCYYSSEVPIKDSQPEDSCTFSDTFTISDNLPPVSLYSAEVINKLLKYYGYYENDSPKNYSKKMPNKDNSTFSNQIKFKPKLMDNNLIPDYFKKDVRFPNIREKYSETKAKKISKILDQDKRITGNKHIELFIKSRNTGIAERKPNSSHNEVTEYEAKHRSGRLLNSPTNINATRANENIIQSTNRINGTENRSTSLNNKVTSEEDIKESKYSTYMSESSHYIGYVGTFLVVTLMLFSMVLWVIFQLRHRRRRSIVEELEQIEVATISGGVWW